MKKETVRTWFKSNTKLSVGNDDGVVTAICEYKAGRYIFNSRTGPKGKFENLEIVSVSKPEAVEFAKFILEHDDESAKELERLKGCETMLREVFNSYLEGKMKNYDDDFCVKINKALKGKK